MWPLWSRGSLSWTSRVLAPGVLVVGVVLVPVGSADATAMGRRDCAKLKGAAAQMYDQKTFCRNLKTQAQPGKVDIGKALQGSLRTPRKKAVKGRRRMGGPQRSTTPQPRRSVPAHSSAAKSRTSNKRPGSMAGPDVQEPAPARPVRGVAERRETSAPISGSSGHRPDDSVTEVLPRAGKGEGRAPVTAPAPWETSANTSTVSAEHSAARPTGRFAERSTGSGAEMAAQVGAAAAVMLAAATGGWLLTVRGGGVARLRYRRRPHRVAAAPPPKPVPTASQKVPVAPSGPSGLAVPIELGSDAARPVLVDLAATGGLQLIGPDARDAERALMVQALVKAAAGECRILTTRSDLTEILGEQGAQRAAAMAGVQVADTCEEALTELGAAIVGRTSDDGSDTPTAAAHDDETEEPVPLVCVLTVAEHDIRLRADLCQGAALKVGAVVRGDWPHGATVNIEQATVTKATGPGVDRVTGASVPLLDTAAAYERLPVSASSGAASTAAGAAETAAQGEALGLGRVRTVEKPGMVRLMGQYVIEGPSGQVCARTTDLRALLGLLAEHNSTLLTPTTAAAKMWEGDPPSRDRLRTLLKDARGKLCDALGQPAGQGRVLIENVRATGYRLNDKQLTCDVWEFHDLLKAAATADQDTKQQLLNRAVELYQGPYLLDLQHGWAQTASRLTAGHVVQALAQLASLQDGPEPAAAHLERAVGIDPGQQHIHRRLMQAYAAMGRLDAVRTTYQRLAEHLRAQAGKPELQTTRLYEKLTTVGV
ncbi:AfsR/SARP family transcriptional regulator [Actinomadura parmotrematis]|nr:BTAD domain-containing putative transcriptional regulator [Actinomadura parmotrematis]